VAAAVVFIVVFGVGLIIENENYKKKKKSGRKKNRLPDLKKKILGYASLREP